MAYFFESPCTVNPHSIAFPLTVPLRTRKIWCGGTAFPCVLVHFNHWCKDRRLSGQRGGHVPRLWFPDVGQRRPLPPKKIAAQKLPVFCCSAQNSRTFVFSVDHRINCELLLYPTQTKGQVFLRVNLIVTNYVRRWNDEVFWVFLYRFLEKTFNSVSVFFPKRE